MKWHVIIPIALVALAFLVVGLVQWINWKFNDDMRKLRDGDDGEKKFRRGRRRGNKLTRKANR